MISVDEAVEKVLSHVDVLDPENKPLLESLGQVLAEDIYPGLASIHIKCIHKVTYS